MENDMTDSIVDVLLLRAISDNKEKVKEYQVKVTQFNTQIGILLEENKQYLSEYQKMCIHSTSTKSSVYAEGGYDHVSYTVHTYKCDRCGKVTGTKEERGSYA